MKKFNVGDLVYHPKSTTRVVRLEAMTSTNYPLCLDGGSYTFTETGMAFTHDITCSIFLATVENQRALEILYKVPFQDVPPKTKTLVIEVPQTFIPAFGDKYWYISPGSEQGAFSAHNTNSLIDQYRIKHGVWRKPSEALQVANALFNTGDLDEF